MQEAGAKKKPRSEIRQKGRIVPFRVSEKEYAKLQEFADRHQLTIGSYVRSRALHKPPTVDPSKPDDTTTRAKRRPTIEAQVLGSLLAQLGKIGSNLNQLAKRSNSGEQVDIQAALAEHRQILAAIIQTLGKQSK